MENSQQSPSVDYAEMQAIATQMLTVEKKNQYQVRNVLEEKGMDKKEAYLLVYNLQEKLGLHQYSESSSGSDSDSNMKDIAIGALILMIGIVVTFVSYSSASSGGGGKYVVAYGAIIYGGIKMLMGIFSSK